MKGKKIAPVERNPYKHDKYTCHRLIDCCSSEKRRKLLVCPDCVAERAFNEGVRSLDIALRPLLSQWRREAFISESRMRIAIRRCADDLGKVLEEAA